MGINDKRTEEIRFSFLSPIHRAFFVRHKSYGYTAAENHIFRKRSITEKIAAAVYLYQADNDGEWGDLRFDFESGTAEIVKLADWDTVKSNIFAKTAIRYIQGFPEARLLKSVTVPFWKGRA